MYWFAANGNICAYKFVYRMFVKITSFLIFHRLVERRLSFQWSFFFFDLSNCVWTVTKPITSLNHYDFCLGSGA